MLVLSRKASQHILIGPDIVVTVVKIDRNQVRLGIQAPRGISILRQELSFVPDPSSLVHSGPTTCEAVGDGDTQRPCQTEQMCQEVGLIHQGPRTKNQGPDQKTPVGGADVPSPDSSS